MVNTKGSAELELGAPSVESLIPVSCCLYPLINHPHPLRAGAGDGEIFGLEFDVVRGL